MKKICFLVFTLLCNATVSFAQSMPALATDIAPLLIGEIVPNLPLTDVTGTTKNFHEWINQKPTVLIVYRGGWCPYCNSQLGELQSIESKILESGYQIVAINTDAHIFLQASIDKHSLTYTLLSDPSLAFLQAMGVVFQAPEKYVNMLSDRSNKQNKGALPVPAVFFLSPDGSILFEYINPDHSKRISSKLLLAALESL